MTFFCSRGTPKLDRPAFACHATGLTVTGSLRQFLAYRQSLCSLRGGPFFPLLLRLTGNDAQASADTAGEPQPGESAPDWAPPATMKALRECFIPDDTAARVWANYGAGGLSAKDALLTYHRQHPRSWPRR